ncbi:hypothetical protein L208DRAFT_1449605 [Tricholoma matsutake]|nr:hypothetical protein L208DRAFT_1449605 [Tricholoma matsutake 945]
MDLDSTTPAGQPIIYREKTAPFLIRTFVKIGSFHRLSLFEDGTLPTTDEQQLFNWYNATLREVLTALRKTAPAVPEYRHPLAHFSFRTVYADPGKKKGRFSQRDLGMVYSRDILGEPGSLNATAPRLREDIYGENRDYLLIAVLLPKNVTVPTEISIKGSAGPGATMSNGWRGTGVTSGRGDGGDSNPASGHRGRGGRAGADLGFREGGRDRDRDRDGDRVDRRVPPPRRESPPARGRGGWGDRQGGRDRLSFSRSRSRSRTPPRRRR